MKDVCESDFAKLEMKNYQDWLDKTSSYFEVNKDEPPETGGCGWYCKSAGYTAMIAAAVIGPGTLSAMVKGGAIYPWQLGWAVLLSAVFCWIASYAGARTTMLTGRGSIELLRDEIHPLFMWVVLAGCSFSMLVVGWFEGVAIGASMQLLTGMNVKLAAWIFSILLAILYVIRSDIKFAIWVTWALLLELFVCYVLSFIICLSKGSISFGSLITGMFIPSWPEGSGVLIAAAMGGAAGFYVYFMQPYFILEKGSGRPKFLTHAKWDTFFHGLAVFGLYSFLIYWASSAIFPGGGVIPKGAIGAAKSLEPLAGPAAKYLFGLGFLGVALTTCAAVIFYLVYPICAAFKIAPTLRNKTTKWITFFAMCIIPPMGTYMGKELLSFGVFAMAFMVIFTLPVIPAWLYFLNSKKIVGERKASWYLNLGMVVCLIVLCYATYFSVGKMIKFMAG